MKKTPNLDYIKELSGGDSAFEQELIAVMKEEFPDEMMHYLRSIDNKRYYEAFQTVHKMKHKLNVLGLNEAYHLANQHENALRNGDDSLKHDFLIFLNIIDDYIRRL